MPETEGTEYVVLEEGSDGALRRLGQTYRAGSWEEACHLAALAGEQDALPRSGQFWACPAYYLNGIEFEKAMRPAVSRRPLSAGEPRRRASHAEDDGDGGGEPVSAGTIGTEASPTEE